jgi:hypothetical protein
MKHELTAEVVLMSCDLNPESSAKSPTYSAKCVCKLPSCFLDVSSFHPSEPSPAQLDNQPARQLQRNELLQLL